MTKKVQYSCLLGIDSLVLFDEKLSKALVFSSEEKVNTFFRAEEETLHGFDHLAYEEPGIGITEVSKQEIHNMERVNMHVLLDPLAERPNIWKQMVVRVEDLENKPYFVIDVI